MSLGWLKASRNSLNGLAHALRHERSIKQEAVALAGSFLLAPFVASDARHAILLVGSVALVMIVELLNNAVEALADRVTTERDEAIRVAKDCGSAAVTLTILVAAALWLEAIGSRLSS